MIAVHGYLLLKNAKEKPRDKPSKLHRPDRTDYIPADGAAKRHKQNHMLTSTRPSAPGTGLLQAGQQVGDVVPRMAIQASAQSLLVEVMGNQTDASAQDEQTVEHAHVEVILGLLGAEGTAVAHQIDEADGDAAVDVEDQIVFLGSGDGLDSQSIVEHLAAGEALLDELLDELDTQIRVVP